MRDDGLLYFLQIGDGPIKVGYTANMQARLRTLQIWCPYELTPRLAIRAPQVAEFYTLTLFKPHRIRGEWFSPHHFVLSFIEAIRAAGAIPGLPGETPKFDHITHEMRVNYAALIPAIWESKQHLLSALGVKTLPQDRFWFSRTFIYRIILAARELGRELTPAQVVTVLAREKKPIRTRTRMQTRALRASRVKPADFIIETHGAGASLFAEAS